MSAMKMEFICKDSPDAAPMDDAPRVAKSKAAMSALLNDTAPPPPSGDVESDVEMSDREPQEHKEPVQVHIAADTRVRDSDSGMVMLPPPAKKPKLAVIVTGEAASATDQSAGGHTDADGNALSDNENSEDEQVEYAPWEDLELNPAIELVTKVVRESLEAGKTYNKSITAKTSQLIAGCDNVLLELKNLADAREASRKQASKQQGQQEGDCACGIALSMLPLATKADPAQSAAQVTANASKRVQVDEITEDQTNRALFKIEASMERLRELAELIQATSMQGEANLIAKVTLPENAINDLHTAVQASAAAATAAAIAQERGRTAASVLSGRLYTPLQVKKLQEWYYSYPRPLTDELTLMRTILNYRPYVNPFHPGGLTIAQVREWFKRRRYRERIRYIKLAVEAGRDAIAAEEEIDLRIEQRIEHLRTNVVDPNELVKELDKVRAESSMYDAMMTSYARSEVLDSYVSASYGLSSATTDHFATNGMIRPKRYRTQDADLEDAVVVKSGSLVEVSVLQKRIRTLLLGHRTATSTNALQQVIDVLRAMEVTKDVRVQSGIVADLKKILKMYRKPTLLRKSTVALLENLGMTRRIIMDDNAHDEEPMQEVAPPKETPPEDIAMTSSPETPAPSQKQRKKKIQRPMKFSMRQVRALEEWFQERYKPTQGEMEGYLVSLNSPPLRDPKQPIDVTMTQLRRWFNKRRCLRRPPFALMTQQDEADREGGPEDEDAAGDHAKYAEDADDDASVLSGAAQLANLPHMESAENSQVDSSEDDDDSSDEE